MILITTAFLLGFFFALGVFSPRFRLRWAGTPIKCGLIGSMAGSMIFLSWGVRRAYADSLSDSVFHVLVWISIAGWIIATAGFVVARVRTGQKARRTGSMMQDLQRQMITKP